MIKPFYVMCVDDEPQFARSVDLNFGETELSSGGQREHRHEKLIAQIKERKMDVKKFLTLIFYTIVYLFLYSIIWFFSIYRFIKKDYRW